MNYVKVYKQLIQKRRDYPINRTKDNPFVEYHHIIPKSEGGKDSPRNAKYNHKGTNIVGLTIKEHILAHILLSRILNSNNMICAEHFMLTDKNGDKTNLRLAAISKERFKKNQSLTMTEYWKSHEYDCTKLADEKKPRKVWMYDFAGNFIKEYPSMKSVSKELGINIGYIIDACNGIKTGYKNKYRFSFSGKSAFQFEERKFNESTYEYYKFLESQKNINTIYNIIDKKENVNYLKN